MDNLAYMFGYMMERAITMLGYCILAAVFEIEKGYMAHCPSCGAVTFFDNQVLLQRLHFGGKLCPHELEKKPCRGGHTTWCQICRVRSFIYGH